MESVRAFDRVNLLVKTIYSEDKILRDDGVFAGMTDSFK